jgi:hypothetical protein
MLEVRTVAREMSIVETVGMGMEMGMGMGMRMRMLVIMEVTVSHSYRYSLELMTSGFDIDDWLKSPKRDDNKDSDQDSDSESRLPDDPPQTPKREPTPLNTVVTPQKPAKRGVDESPTGDSAEKKARLGRDVQAKQSIEVSLSEPQCQYRQ